MRCDEQQLEQGVRLRMPAEPGSLRSARDRLRAWLEALGVRERVVADVVLAVNEACANAIEHPVARRKPWIDLVARHGQGRLEVAVSDSGRWREGRGGAGRGRGFQLMRSCMDVVTVETACGGTTVRLGRRVD